eukprot:c55561_g1_i1 orf=1-198(-)
MFRQKVQIFRKHCKHILHQLIPHEAQKLIFLVTSNDWSEEQLLIQSSTKEKPRFDTINLPWQGLQC